MINKKLVIALAVATALTVPFSVFAATSDTVTAKNIRGFFGIDTTKLTDKQKADVNDYSQKMAQLQKDFVNKMVENGTLTKEQGEAETKRIDEAVKNGAENGYIHGFGMGKGGFRGHGGKDGFGIGKIDISKLTDAQKADLKTTYTKMVNLQKDVITKAVSAGIITKDQGTTITTKVDEMAKNIESGDFANGMMMGRGGFGLFGFKGIDSTKLTDAQKAIFTGFNKSMTELQKELINKLVSSGILTKVQGDSAIQRIDDMSKLNPENGFLKGDGMRKGHFGGRGRQSIPNTNSSTSTTPSAVQ